MSLGHPLGTGTARGLDGALRRAAEERTSAPPPPEDRTEPAAEQVIVPEQPQVLDSRPLDRPFHPANVRAFRPPGAQRQRRRPTELAEQRVHQVKRTALRVASVYGWT